MPPPRGAARGGRRLSAASRATCGITTGCNGAASRRATYSGTVRGARPQRNRSLRGTLFALAASLAIHLAVLAAAARLASEPARAPAPGRPFAVELYRVPSPGPSATAPRTPARPGGPSRPKDLLRRRPGARTDASAPAPGSAVRRDDRAEGIARAPSEVVPDLRARPPIPPFAVPGGGTARADDALREWARDRAGRSRVENGVVHPYYRDVGHALLRAWNAEQALRARGISGYVAQAGDNLRTFGRVWQRMAQGFAGTGSAALVDGSSPRMKELSGLPAGPARDALVQAEIQRQLRPALSEGHVATVRVTQAADGHLQSVELLSPSKDAGLDRAALDDVRAAARMLPVPPPEALAGRTQLVSIWELEVEISITPPIPVIGVELDEVLGLTDVRVPLDRRIRKRVRLVAVD